MKKVFCVIVLFLVVSCNKNEIKTVLKPSKIDSLDSDTAVQAFIRSTDSLLKNFELIPIQDYKRDSLDDFAHKLADSFNIKKAYYKSDLDNNGLTDLLILCQNYKCENSTRPRYFNPYVIMNFGQKYQIVDIRRDYHASIVVPKIIEEDEKFFLISNLPVVDWDNTKRIRNESTKLIYKFGSFVEYNEKPSNYNIEKIEYSTSPCYGTCPVFKMILNKHGLSTFNAKAYNFSDDYEMYSEKYYGKDEGNFKVNMDKNKYDEIANILNYLDFENLKDDYSISWTDNPGCVLKITYYGGKTKTIDDYGLMGTHGLQRVYKLLSDLRFNQNWK